MLGTVRHQEDVGTRHTHTSEKTQHTDSLITVSLERHIDILQTETTNSRQMEDIEVEKQTRACCSNNSKGKYFLFIY